MSLAAEQLTFDQLMARFRPLLEVQEAAFCLTSSRTSIERLIDTGTLRACDVGLGKVSRALRVYRYALIHVCSGRSEPIEKIAAAEILPHGRPDLLVRELMNLFACTDQHVYNLLAAREIKGPRISKSSQNRMPRATRESVIAFLEKREIA